MKGVSHLAPYITANFERARVEVRQRLIPPRRLRPGLCRPANRIVHRRRHRRIPLTQADRDALAERLAPAEPPRVLVQGDQVGSLHAVRGGDGGAGVLWLRGVVEAAAVRLRVRAQVGQRARGAAHGLAGHQRRAVVGGRVVLHVVIAGDAASSCERGAEVFGLDSGDSALGAGLETGRLRLVRVRMESHGEIRQGVALVWGAIDTLAAVPGSKSVLHGGNVAVRGDNDSGSFAAGDILAIVLAAVLQQDYVRAAFFFDVGSKFIEDTVGSFVDSGTAKIAYKRAVEMPKDGGSSGLVVGLPLPEPLPGLSEQFEARPLMACGAGIAVAPRREAHRG